MRKQQAAKILAALDEIRALVVSEVESNGARATNRNPKFTSPQRMAELRDIKARKDIETLLAKAAKLEAGLTNGKGGAHG